MRSIAPLSCLAIDDLEKLSPYLSDTSLAGVLSARYKRDKSLLSSFWAVDNPVLDRKSDRKATLAGEAGKLGEMVERRLGLKED